MSKNVIGSGIVKHTAYSPLTDQMYTRSNADKYVEISTKPSNRLCTLHVKSIKHFLLNRSICYFTKNMIDTIENKGDSSFSVVLVMRALVSNASNPSSPVALRRKASVINSTSSTIQDLEESPSTIHELNTLPNTPTPTRINNTRANLSRLVSSSAENDASSSSRCCATKTKLCAFVFLLVVISLVAFGETRAKRDGHDLSIGIDSHSPFETTPVDIIKKHSFRINNNNKRDDCPCNCEAPIATTTHAIDDDNSGRRCLVWA